MSDSARLAVLEQQVASLTTRLTRLELEANSTRRPRFRQRALAADAAPRFRPVEPAACLHLSPCLRTTARDRLGRGCASSVWSGRWSVRPAAGGANLRNADAWETQRFHSAAAAACDVADPFVVAPALRGRARATPTVATEQYTLGRLEGVRNALWLMVGTSIDHGITYEVCVRFGREVLVAKAAPTNLHPKPGLTFQWCRLPSPLNLTMAEASLHGLTALAFQRDASRYATHLSELQALLTTIGHGAGPDFVSLAGAEWDFKQFGIQGMQPSTADDWGAIRSSLEMQLGAARRQWPRVRGVFLRTQFATTYRWSAKWKDLDGSVYAKYSDIMREIAAEGSPEYAAAAGVPATAPPACGRAGVLDISAMMNCSFERPAVSKVVSDFIGGSTGTGKCGRESGWTRDGLHPNVWVYLRYFAMSTNVLADFGESCRPGVVR